jgi:lipopolysaccharide export system protein LptA
MRTARLGCCCLLSVLALPLAAADRERDEPMHLRADRIVIDQKSGISRYQGHVRFSQGELLITAARAEAHHRGDTLVSVTAEGQPATFRDLPPDQTEPLEGVAQRLEFEAESRRVHLYENVEIHHDGDDVKAGSMHYDPSLEQVIADRDEHTRVYTAITPRRDGEGEGTLLPGLNP